jgi:hypothetical protein
MSPKAKHLGNRLESRLGQLGVQLGGQLGKMISIAVFATSLIVAAHAGGDHAAGGSPPEGGHQAASSGARDDDMAFNDDFSSEENSSSLDDKSGGLGFVLVPNCSPFYGAGGPGGSLLPFSGGAMGPVQTCNPSDLSGPSQQAGQAQTLAEQDNTSQPPAGSSSYIYGGSALSSPERPNGGAIFPNLYPPNTSQGSLYHSNGVGTPDDRGNIPRANNVVTNSAEGTTEVNPQQ